MSFLPYASPTPGAWFASLGFSAVAHTGMASVLFLSGSVAFLPNLDPQEFEESEITVSLEILDADIIEEVDPFDPAAIPEDAIEITPESFEAEAPEDLAALAPDEAEILTPEEEVIALEEPELLVPEEPEITPKEPEPAPIEAIEPEVLETPIEEPLVAEVPEPVIEEPVIEEPVVAEPIIAEPVVEEPVVEQPLIVEDLSPIEETVINPLAEGGGGAAPLAPEIIEDPEPDLLALVAPEPELITPLPVEPDVDGPAPVALPLEEELLTPEIVDEETQPEILPDPVEEPEILTPEAVDEDPQAPEIVEEETQTPEVVEEAPQEPAAAEPTTPSQQVIANPSRTDLAIGQMIRRIRALPQESCTLALPRRAGGTPGGGLSLVGQDEDTLTEIGRRIVDGLNPEGLIPAPLQTIDIIDPRQCSLLDALRQSDDYPVSRLGLALDNAQLASGDTLTARVLGAGGLFLTLLVIDDNGVVQDLAPFTGLEGNEPVITVPVARSGPARATRQLIVALGTQGEPIDLSGLIGELAQDVFSAIPAEQLAGTSFAFAAFDVR